MKPLPTPKVTGNTEAERMSNALRTIFSVSKEALLKAEAREKRVRSRGRRAKKPS